MRESLLRLMGCCRYSGLAGIYTSLKKAGKPTRLPKLSGENTILIIGNGMVGFHLCKSLVKRELHLKHKIIVLGGEDIPAYDRIHLSSYVDDRSQDNLILEKEQWYAENGIELSLGDAVERVNREAKKVITKSGGEYQYDQLIFATGSRAMQPPIEGISQEKVILYRTVKDIQNIVQQAEGKSHATIIGGGLLGLEAAQGVQKLGLKSSVIQLSSYLMPAQLNPKAAKVLQEKVDTQGIQTFLGANTKSIKKNGDRLLVSLADGRSIDTDLVIVATGITPNSEVAKEADILCGIRGGIVVDNHLQTSDEHIHAVGECALLDGKIFGLAAPGYAMAEHLVSRLAGDKLSPLDQPDLSTKLKMVGVEVTSIGAPLQEGVIIEFQADDIYRAITLTPKGELLGALGIGEWPEGNKIQSLFREKATIKQKERDYFIKEGVLHQGGGESSVLNWEDSRLVCNCMGITKGEIIGCFKTCGKDPDAIAKETSCSDVCGSCRPLLEELCYEQPVAVKKPKGVRRLLLFSVIAILGIIGVFISPPAPMADSVESWYWKVDKLWRTNLTKQITGYAIMLIFLIGLLISLRKRFKWFRFGQFNQWRVFHSVFGVASLVTLFAHTGFHFGENLNYWLMLCFVLLNLLGGVAGVFSALESSGTSNTALFARKYRPILTYLHLILFWPLPVLLGFHIASVYLY